MAESKNGEDGGDGEDEAECDERECDEPDEVECDGEGVVDSPEGILLLLDAGLGRIGGKTGRGGWPSASRIKNIDCIMFA